MKKYYFFIFIPLLFFSTCAKDDDDLSNATNPNEGLLSKVEYYSNSILSDVTEIFYDESQRVSALRLSPVGRDEGTYHVDYTAGEVSSITITRQDVSGGGIVTTNRVYNVIHEANLITLNSDDNQIQIIIEQTNGYVDSYKYCFETNSVNCSKSTFIRGIDMNIDTVSTYLSLDAEADYLRYHLLFSDFNTNFSNLKPALNPVYCIPESTLGFYNHMIGLCLNLKISNETPSKSTVIYYSNNVPFPQNAVEITGSTTNNKGQFRRLNYEKNSSPFSAIFSWQ